MNTIIVLLGETAIGMQQRLQANLKSAAEEQPLFLAVDASCMCKKQQDITNACKLRIFEELRHFCTQTGTITRVFAVLDPEHASGAMLEAVCLYLFVTLGYRFRQDSVIQALVGLSSDAAAARELKQTCISLLDNAYARDVTLYPEPCTADKVVKKRSRLLDKLVVYRAGESAKGMEDEMLIALYICASAKDGAEADDAMQCCAHTLSANRYCSREPYARAYLRNRFLARIAEAAMQAEESEALASPGALDACTADICRTLAQTVAKAYPGYQALISCMPLRSACISGLSLQQAEAALFGESMADTFYHAYAAWQDGNCFADEAWYTVLYGLIFDRFVIQMGMTLGSLQALLDTKGQVKNALLRLMKQQTAYAQKVYERQTYTAADAPKSGLFHRKPSMEKMVPQIVEARYATEYAALREELIGTAASFMLASLEQVRADLGAFFSPMLAEDTQKLHAIQAQLYIGEKEQDCMSKAYDTLLNARIEDNECRGLFRRLLQNPRNTDAYTFLSEACDSLFAVDYSKMRGFAQELDQRIGLLRNAGSGTSAMDWVKAIGKELHPCLRIDMDIANDAWQEEDTLVIAGDGLADALKKEGELPAGTRLVSCGNTEDVYIMRQWRDARIRNIF